MNVPFIMHGNANPILSINSSLVSVGFNHCPICFHNEALRNLKETFLYAAVLDALTPPTGILGNAKRTRARVERSLRIVHGDTTTQIFHPELNLVSFFNTFGMSSPNFWVALDALCPIPDHSMCPAELLEEALREDTESEDFALLLVIWVMETPGAAQFVQSARKVLSNGYSGHYLPLFLDIADKLVAEEVQEAIGAACVSHPSASRSVATSRI